MYRFIKWLKKPSGRYFQLTDGRMFDFERYDSKVDLLGGFVIGIDGGATYRLCKFKTINELVAEGVLVEGVPYQEYTICLGENELVDVAKIVEEFRANGFDVSARGVEHNFFAWQRDMKSGYRGRSCHLFSPCGCNPLSFTATTLHPTCKDWQKTYMC